MWTRLTGPRRTRRRYERKGKWLDAYVMCYSWLAAIEPNNKAYSDYAEQLIDKAEIAGSFQDSPVRDGQAADGGRQEADICSGG